MTLTVSRIRVQTWSRYAGPDQDTAPVALLPLTEDGELPLGVHAAFLREVLDRFGVGSAQRKALALRVARVYRMARGNNRDFS